MEIALPYGRGTLALDLPESWNVTLLERGADPGLSDEGQALRDALRSPTGTLPLRDLAQPHDSVAIVFSDRTRPMPNDRVLPILLEELGHIPSHRVQLINALGLHRQSPREELQEMLGAAVVDRYRVLQHDPYDHDMLVNLGDAKSGHPVQINKAYAEASVRILTGFIEPHFFAGFSGGPKAVLPGIAGAETILGNHSSSMLKEQGATWGVTHGNPLWEEMAGVCRKLPPSFLLNVTLNKEGGLTGVFAGDWHDAHSAGCAHAAASCFLPVEDPFDIVVTTNSGFPLDLNLYQAVKGMSAAARVVKPGGDIVIAAACSEGLPDHGRFREILGMGDTPQQWLQVVDQPGFSMVDQWEVQVLAQILTRARVWLKTEGLAAADYDLACVERCDSLEKTLQRLVAVHGTGTRICVVPEGPLVIPTLGQG